MHTDGWLGYECVQAHGYRHRITYLSEHPEPANQLLPHVHLVTSLLKRWLLGTHQGAVSPAHLDYYLDEFTFRFNRRSSRHRGMLFYRLAQQAVQVALCRTRPWSKTSGEALGETTRCRGHLSQLDNQHPWFQETEQVSTMILCSTPM